MTYRMIQRCRTAFPIRMMCRCVRVSPSGYYSWATRSPSGRGQENAQLLVRIHQLHAEHDGVVGARASEKTCAMLGSGVDATGWHA
jgi:putative transposase